MFGMGSEGGPDLSRMVLREFRMSSITLKRDALDAIVSVIKREDDAAGALRLIMATLQERMRRSSGDAVAVDRAMVVAAVEESSRAEDDRKREALQVVSAFKTPHYTFNASRRTYHLDTLARPLHGSAKHKIAMLRGRLAQVQQRLTRSSRFRRPVSAKAAKETAWVELSSIESLVTKEGERATVLGMLVPAGPGSATRWALEDLHSRVPVSLEECQRMPGLYTESSILLAQGQMDDEGVFHVWHAGMPPPESRTDSLVALGVVDQYQILRTPAEWEAASELEERDTGASFNVFSDCAMDQAVVRARLRRCLETFDAQATVPRLIVLCGPFHSVPFGAQAGARRAFAASVAALVDIFSATPNIAAHSHVVLVPAASDPGSASVLPRAALPEAFCKPLRKVLRHLTLATNPCRILFHTQEIVIFRDNASSRMRRHCVIRPKDDNEGGEEEEGVDVAASFEDGTGAASSSSAVVPASQESGGAAPPPSPPRTPSFTMERAAEAAVHKHLASTVVSQAHLCPLPLQVQPVYWAHDAGLRLFPLPDIVIMADDADEYIVEQPCDVDTTVASPGSIGRGTFLGYEPASRMVVRCSADAAIGSALAGTPSTPVHESSSSARPRPREAAQQSALPVSWQRDDGVMETEAGDLDLDGGGAASSSSSAAAGVVSAATGVVGSQSSYGSRDDSPPPGSYGGRETSEFASPASRRPAASSSSPGVTQSNVASSAVVGELLASRPAAGALEASGRVVDQLLASRPVAGTALSYDDDDDDEDDEDDDDLAGGGSSSSRFPDKASGAAGTTRGASSPLGRAGHDAGSLSLIDELGDDE